MDSSCSKQSPILQLVESSDRSANKRTVEARDIAPRMRQEIADEFRVVKSSRVLARKYRLPQHVVSDILHLHLRKEPQSERLTPMAVFARRQA